MILSTQQTEQLKSLCCTNSCNKYIKQKEKYEPGNGSASDMAWGRSKLMPLMCGYIFGDNDA
jgi:hypothetical protein